MRKQNEAKTLAKIRASCGFLFFVDTSPFSKAQYDESVWIASLVLLTRNDGSGFVIARFSVAESKQLKSHKF